MEIHSPTANIFYVIEFTAQFKQCISDLREKNHPTFFDSNMPTTMLQWSNSNVIFRETNNSERPHHLILRRRQLKQGNLINYCA